MVNERLSRFSAGVMASYFCGDQSGFGNEASLCMTRRVAIGLHRSVNTRWTSVLGTLSATREQMLICVKTNKPHSGAHSIANKFFITMRGSNTQKFTA